MQRICLDKTINLTRGIMNEDVQIPTFVEVKKELGLMDRFNFVNSKVELPIEHIGLAILSYQGAVEQFTVTRINEDKVTGEKNETRDFESLIGTGVHVSDFLSSISPDALNWYFNENGYYKMEYMGNRVPFSSSKDYNQCKSYSGEGEDIRELTIREAYNQALKGYVQQELEGTDEETDAELQENLRAFVEDDSSSFGLTMDELKLESTKLVINPNREQSQDESRTVLNPERINPPSETIIPFPINLGNMEAVE